MAVDGIGGAGSKPVFGVGPGAPAAAGEVDAPVAAGVEGSTSTTSAESVGATTPLEQLQRGEIDVEHYLDVRVDSAVRPFEGRVSDAQLEFMKDSLRDALSNDPVVVELLRRTTSAIPSPRE
jgi:hypothetical protein